jgi:dihydrofolate reductase
MNNLSIIVAIGKDYEIGLKNQLLWHISDDLKHFKQLTSGKPVIMGENTWFSLPKRPLPKRRNMVLTLDKEAVFEGAETLFSIDEALQAVASEEEVIVMGGASIYRQFMPLASKLYITHVMENFEADTWFPKIESSEWSLINKSDLFLDSESQLSYYFAEYHRKNN